MKVFGREVTPIENKKMLSEMKKAKHGTQFIIDIITHKKEEGDSEVEVVMAQIIRTKSK